MVVIPALTEQRARHALRVLSQYARIRAAYVFGSQSTGTDKWSDIDLAVFLDGLETWSLPQRARTAALIQKEVGDDIELHFFSARKIDELPPASFAAFVIDHGVSVFPEENA